MPGGNVVKICKINQTRCTASLAKQGYFLYLCTSVHPLLPQLTVCEFQMASGGYELNESPNDSIRVRKHCKYKEQRTAAVSQNKFGTITCKWSVMKRPRISGRNIDD